ncbi:MAG: protein translocase subunit SecF [Candidatus Magasanikbacteria bacterium]|nr:protein translocase subunit SecF [Candidatus Magasanikbacteria bacterium]
MNIPFVKYSKVWFGISILTVVVALSALFFWGLKYGIDFTGGSLVEVSFSKERPKTDALLTVLDSLGLKEHVVQTSGDDRFIVRTSFLTEDQHQALIKRLRETFEKDGNTVHEESLQTIGAAVSEQLRSRALWAIVWVNVAIILYVAYAFRKVSKPVASWQYGLLAIVALAHDILVVLGAFAFFGRFLGIEVETDFVLALLTVLGFSVTDTIVVYDRIRENVLHHSAENFSDTVNIALNQTLMRSMNTTLTVLLPLFALFFLGGETIHNFALALLIGMASGAYSSIFIASPLLVYVEKWARRRAVSR